MFNSKSAISSILIIVFTVLFCSQAQAFPAAISSSERPATWKWQTEEEWLVDSINRDIAEILLFAASKQKAGSSFTPADLKLKTATVNHDAESYRAEIESSLLPAPIKREFTLDKCIFGIQNYAPLAQQILDSSKLLASETAGEPEADKKLLQSLSDGKTSTLFEENFRISRELNKNPLNADLHEQAALMTATFELSDLASNFYDPRPALARITAHLAVAQALRAGKPAGICGQIALAAQIGMSSRDTEAVQVATDLEKIATEPNVKSWVRMLKIIGTNDYREWSNSDSTQIEDYQYGKRLAFFVDAESILEFLKKHNQPMSIQWVRIGQNGSQSVESGSIFMKMALALELDDFYKDYKLYNFKTFTDASLAPELNKLPTRCLVENGSAWELQVLSWPDVANFHARHILGGFIRSYIYNAEIFGDKERTEQSMAKAEKELSGLTLYPFCYPRIALSKEKLPAQIQRAAAVIANSPEIVTSTSWIRMADQDKSQITKPVLWFGTLPLFGTAMSFYSYDSGSMLSPKLDLPTLTRYRDLAIYNRSVCEAWTEKKYGKHPTSKQWEEGYGKMMEFDLRAMETAANGDYKNPAVYIPLMQKIAKWKPNFYLKLGSYCALLDRDAEAAAFFEKGIKEGADDVIMANDSHWLINYWYDHGRKADAERLADHAAEVYSHGGLEARASLYEREGKMFEAEEVYKNIEIRYDRKDDLNGFYVRRRTANPRFDSAAQVFLTKTGLRKATPADRQGVPLTGVRVTAVPFWAEYAGIKEGEIIVCLNGYKIRSEDDYHDVAAITYGLDRRNLLVWNGKSYRDVNAKVFANSIGFSIETYKAANKASH